MDGAKRGSTAILTVLLFFLFIPFAFSEEFIEASFEAFGKRAPWWTLLVADILMLSLVIAPLGYLASRRSRTWKVSWGCFLAVSLLTLGVDVFAGKMMVTRDPAFLPQLLATLAYAVLLAALIASLVGSLRMPYAGWLCSKQGTSRGGDHPDRAVQVDDKSEFRFAVPLILGTLAAYLGGHFFDYLSQTHSPGSPAIDQEYFAQVSQIIPLLLIAIGFEASHFKGWARYAVGRAATIVTVVLLCFGEVLALTTLPMTDEVRNNAAGSWHEFTSFIITLEACFIALAMLIWALLSERDELGIVSARA